MSISKRNAEGYLVLPEYYALTNIEEEERKKRYRPLVYICSPYRGDVTANTRRAQKYSKYAVDMGYIPLALHLLFPQFLNDNDPYERELGLFFGIVLLSKCDELWVFGREITDGMKQEIAYAKRKNKPIRYFKEDIR